MAPATRFSAACLVALTAIVTPVAAQDQAKPSLTVIGEGTAHARPDMATISIAVVKQAARAADALAQNSKAMTEVIAAAKEGGIEARDLETTGISVRPVYSVPAQGSREPPRIAAYEVSNNVSVRVRVLDRLGGLLDKLVVTGANDVRNIDLSVVDPAPHRDAARIAAIKDALRKAGLLAVTAGVRIVRISSISEGGSEPPRPMTMRMAPAEARAPVPIEAGEQEFRARVTMIFEIEPR